MGKPPYCCWAGLLLELTILAQTSLVTQHLQKGFETGAVALALLCDGAIGMPDGDGVGIELNQRAGS